MDLHESAEGNLVTATFDLPGLKKEDVIIDVHNNRLVVSGTTVISNEANQDGWVVRERRSGKFSRSLPLPAGTQVSCVFRYSFGELFATETLIVFHVQAEQIKASMENGVLTVTFPKASPEQTAKRITIS